MNPNRFAHADLGFQIDKPADWVFLPTPWALSFRRRMDPTDEELSRVMALAQTPFVYFHYDHGRKDIAYPTVQCTCRALPPQGVDRRALLAQSQAQLENTFETLEILESTTDAIVSGFPANRITARFSLYGENDHEFACESLSVVVFAGRLAFVMGLSGPTEGVPGLAETLRQVLASVRIG
jgi:hypothetical protein